MPSAFRRANSTAQPGSSTITWSPARSKVRLTISSAWVAPTVVMMFSGAACTLKAESFFDNARRNPVSPLGSPYCSENCCSARVPVTLRTAAGMKVDSSHSDGNTPMPGCGLSLTLWNIPRISAVASIGAGWRASPASWAPAPPAARPCPRAESGRAGCGVSARLSRTKKPRFLRASTRPCASSWSYAATTVDGLTPCCCAHCRTEGRRAPGASSRSRMRWAKRADNCSVSDCEEAFISMANVLVYWRGGQYSSPTDLGNCTAGVLIRKATVILMNPQPGARADTA